MLFALFISEGRVRAGWRFLSFAAASVVLLLTLEAVLKALPLTAPLVAQAGRGSLTLTALLLLDGAALTVVVALTAIAARLEGRPWSAYGMPLRRAAVRRCGEGAMWGLAMITLTTVTIWCLGGVSFEGPTSSVPTLVLYGAGWAVAFLLVGLYEELLFRGYALVTLSEGIGFWPAAVLLAVVFGALHLTNAGESGVGALNVVAYALFASLTLRRTGNLWFAIGVHAAWDYAQSALFAEPGSGMQVVHPLLRTHFHGPIWLTGGAVGPEGGVVAFATLALAFVAVSWRFPAADRQRSAAGPAGAA